MRQCEFEIFDHWQILIEHYIAVWAHNVSGFCKSCSGGVVLRSDQPYIAGLPGAPVRVFGEASPKLQLPSATTQPAWSSC